MIFIPNALIFLKQKVVIEIGDKKNNQMWAYKLKGRSKSWDLVMAK